MIAKRVGCKYYIAVIHNTLLMSDLIQHEIEHWCYRPLLRILVMKEITKVIEIESEAGLRIGMGSLLIT